jgi:hypothetical protein
MYRHFYRITQLIDPDKYKDRYGNPTFQLPKFMISIASPVFPNMKFEYNGIEYKYENVPMFNFPSIHLNGLKDQYAPLLTCH